MVTYRLSLVACTLAVALLATACAPILQDVDPPRFTVNVSVVLAAGSPEVDPADVGEVRISPEAASYAFGESIDISARPLASGWVFRRWEGDVSGPGEARHVEVVSDFSAQAVFEQLDTEGVGLDLQVSTDHSDRLADGEVPGRILAVSFWYNAAGDQVVMLEAEASRGWGFQEWSGDIADALEVDGNSITITLDEARTVEAKFTPNGLPVRLTLNAQPEGSGSFVLTPDPEGTENGDAVYLTGTRVAVTPTAGSGYTFSRFAGDESTTAGTLIFTIQGDTSVTGVFHEVRSVSEIATLDRAESLAPDGTLLARNGDVLYRAGSVLEVIDATVGGAGNFLLESIQLESPARDIAHVNDTLYLSLQSHGLCVFDTSSDLEAPSRRLTYLPADFDNAPERVDVHGLYVDPATPNTVYLTGEMGTEVDADGHLAGVDGVVVLEVDAAAGSATELGSLETSFEALDLAVDTGSDTAWVAAGTDGVRGLDVAAPGSISEIFGADHQSGAPAYTDPSGNEVEPAALQVLLDGTMLYAAFGIGGMDILNVSNPTNPTVAAEYRPASWDERFIRRLVLDGSTVYAAKGSQGVEAIDVSTPSSPSRRSLAATTKSATDVLFDGSGTTDTLFINERDQGVHALDASNPATLSLSSTVGSSLPLMRVIRDVAASGDTAYLAAGYEGVLSVSASDRSFVEATATDTAGPALAVAVTDTHLFVGRGSEGLEVFDSGSLAYVSSLGGDPFGDDNVTDIAVNGDTLYTAGGTAALHVVAGAESGSLAYSGSYDLPAGANFDRSEAVAVDGARNYAFVAAGASGLLCLDLAAPLGEVTPYQVFPEGFVSDVLFLPSDPPGAERLVVAVGSAGVLVLDVSSATFDPAADPPPSLEDLVVGTFEEVNVDAESLAWTGEYVAAVGPAGGLLLLNIDDPTDIYRVNADSGSGLTGTSLAVVPGGDELVIGTGEYGGTTAGRWISF